MQFAPDHNGGSCPRFARLGQYNTGRVADRRHRLFGKNENSRCSRSGSDFGLAAFAGIVTRMDGNEWQVANILVRVSSKTRLPGQPIQVGTAVRVFGITNGGGHGNGG